MNPRSVFLATIVAITPAMVAAQTDYSKVEYRTELVREGLYMLSTGVGGNVGVLVGSDGVVVIDDQFEPLAPKLRAAVALLSEKPLRFLINTHWHGDHTGANESLGRTGSVIVAHGNVRKRMSSKHVSTFFGREIPPSPAAALPIVTFDQNVTLHLNGETLEVTHLRNAHTDGDAVIYFRNANVLHTGDLFFFNLGYPFIDESSGGTLDGFIAAAAAMLGMIDDSTRIIPGHGALASKADLREYHDMLVAVRAQIVKLIRQRKTQEEVIAARPTAVYDAKWSSGFFKPDVWVGRAYVDLKRSIKYP